jgi:hypothetical protein
LSRSGAAATGRDEHDEHHGRGDPQHRSHVPVSGFDVASHLLLETVNVLLMPMLHGCAFPGCSTFTLSTYCVEHELLVRAVKESERIHAPSHDLASDAPLTAGAAEEAQRQEPAPL